MAAGQLDSVGKFLRKLADLDQVEHASDGDLLTSFLVRRDENAFVTLLHRHGPLVLGVSQRVLGNTPDAEDAFQATFLIFLRNARSIAKQGSVSSWLHGVAHRVAVRAKTNGLRRRVVEQQARIRFDSDALQEAVWQDIRAILDVEVSRLPKACRQAFVLCYMQGKSNAEAARLLFCPTGTIQSRLSRAREILRGRLSRRGLAFSAGMIATMLAQSRTEAAVPVHVTASVLRASKGLTLSKALAAGAISARAAALVEEVTSSVIMAKTAISAAFILTASLAVGAVALSVRAPVDSTRATTAEPVQALPAARVFAVADSVRPPPGGPAAKPAPPPTGPGTLARSFDVQPGEQLLLDVDRGNVEVATWDRNVVRIVLTRTGPGLEDFLKYHQVEMARQGRHVVVHAMYEKGLSSSGSIRINYVITAPKKFDVNLTTGDGSALVSNINGAIEAKTSSGSLRFTGNAGRVKGRSGNGRIEVTDCQGAVDVATHSGELRLSKLHGPVTGHSGNGRVLASLDAPLRAENVLHTDVGDLTVELPATAALYLAATANQGTIDSQFAGGMQSRDGAGNSRMIVLNGGGPSLRLEAKLGNIQIEKR